MEGIGERLKRKREELGLSIEQAAEATKFRPELIEAVEEGRPGMFNAPVYQDGFIRGYARMLGLDGDALVKEQKSEEERAQEALRGIRPRPVSAPKLRRTAMVVIAVAVVGVFASILIDKLVIGPEEPAEPGQETSATRAAAKPAPDSVSRGTPAARSRQMDYIPEPPQTAGPGAAAPGTTREATTPGSATAGSAIPGTGTPGAAAPGPAGSLGSVSVADLYAGRGAQVDPGTVGAPGGEGVAGENQVVSGQASAAGRPGLAATPSGSTRAGQVAAQPSAGARSLEVAVGRHSVYLILASGDQVIYDGWVYGGMRKMFKGDEFVIVSLSSVDGVSLMLDGRPVALPEIDPAGQKSIGDWPVR